MAVEYKPYNNFIEYLDYIDIDISNTSRLYLILAKLFGKLSHANLRFMIFDKLNIKDYSKEFIPLLPKYAFRINDYYYSPYLITSSGLIPVSFYSPKLKSINYTYMKAVYRDLIKFIEFYSEEFNYRGTFKFEYSLRRSHRCSSIIYNNMIFEKQHINFNHLSISLTKRTFDELVREFNELAFKYDDDNNYIYTYEDVKKDLLESKEEKKKEKEHYLEDDEFSIKNYDGSFIEAYVMSIY